jgi:hypothetical protein
MLNNNQDLSSRICIPNRSNSSCGGLAGDSIIKQLPSLVFGNAITSRIDAFELPFSANSAMYRSRPSAKPACGGAPFSRASTNLA